jgi:hypothetical protein
MADDEQAAALERKRKRLEAWRKRQEEKAKASETELSKTKVTLSLGIKAGLKRKNKKSKQSAGIVRFDEMDEKDSKDESDPSSNFLELISLEDQTSKNDKKNDHDSSPTKKKRRWGVTLEASEVNKSGTVAEEDDDLDKFMKSLNSGAMGKIENQMSEGILSTDLNGSLTRPTLKAQNSTADISGGVITPEELANLMSTKQKSKSSTKEDDSQVGPSELGGSASEVSLGPIKTFAHLWLIHCTNSLCPDHRPQLMMKRRNKKEEPFFST